MKRCIAMSALSAACFFLASCHGPRDADGPPNANAKSKSDEPAEKKTSLADLPCAFVAKLDANWNLLAEDSAKIRVDPNKDTFVHVELWENGKRSDRIAAVSRPLINPNGEITIATHETDQHGNKGYKIEIGDGLGGSAVFYEMPPSMSQFVSPLPREIAVKESDPVPFYFLCVGKDCTPRIGESAHDVATRVEYAIVLSLGETEKK